MKFLALAFLVTFFATTVLSEDVSSTTSTPDKTDPPPSPSPTPDPNPPTTPAPKPIPVDPKQFPEAGHYTLKSGNVSCLNVTFAAQFMVDIHNDTKNATQYLSIVNATVEGSCPADVKTSTELDLKLVWTSNSNTNNTAYFSFKRSDAGQKNESQWLDKIQISFTNDFGVNQTVDFTNHLFVVNGTDKNYECKAETKSEVSLDAVRKAKVTFKNVQIDAFRSAADTHKSLTVCAADEDVNDMIPIAVGAALLALVAIVMVAYFIGRRRSRRLAYQSV